MNECTVNNPAARIFWADAKIQTKDEYGYDIELDADGFVSFSSEKRTSSTINKEVNTFVWNVTQIESKTTGCGVAATTVPVTVYTVLATPTGPWDPLDSTSLAGYPYPVTDNRMQPWVTVLETITSTAWCEGDATKEEAAATITKNLYEGGRFRYEPSGPMVYQVNTTPPYFNLTQFHNQLTHPSPSATTVGCADMAWGVVVLSNLIGDNLKVMILIGSTLVHTGDDPSGNPIYQDRLVTKSILPIGETTATTKDWGYHAVAWRGASGSSGTVYDACLKVNDGAAWKQPINMAFANYESLLAISSINIAGFYENFFTPIHRLD